MKRLVFIIKFYRFFVSILFAKQKKVVIFAFELRKKMRLIGEMAERSNAAVLKTVDCNRSGGSNPSFSASFLTRNKLKP